MASVAIDIGGALLKTMLYAKTIWDQRNDNNEVAEELTLFIKDLQVNLKALDTKQLANNNSSTWSMAVLKEDLEKAHQDAQNILKMGFIKKLWNSKRIKEELRVLRERVMTSFQVKLLFTTLDVTIDNRQNQKEFLGAMSRVQQELNQTHAETSAAHLREVKNVIRSELQQMWQTVQAEMQAQGQSVEDAIQVVKGTGFQAQTDDTEKFFADVLMELENAMRDRRPGEVDTSGEVTDTRKSKPGLIKWYHDPITWDIMCDPVKASDRRTYDRWTLLNNSSMSRSPFDPSEDRRLKVEFDDIDVRSRLFQKFPEQEQKCKARREEYREQALEKASQGFVGDALVMLNHVLDWAEEDSECLAKRDQMQGLVNRELLNESGPGSPAASHHSHHSDSGEGGLGESKDPGTDLVVHTRLSDREKVAISRDNLTVTTLSSAEVCFQTPCPPGSFYFEMKVKNKGAKGRIAIGFSTAASFKFKQLPGLYNGSWAYHGEDGPVPRGYAAAIVKGRERLGIRNGDTVGAGVLHKSRQIYFTHNGALVGVLAAAVGTDLPQLYPTVGLRDQHAKVTLNFGKREFVAQAMPARLDQASCYRQARAGLISISARGMEAQYVRTKRNVTLFNFWKHYPASSVRADCAAPCGLPSYYFELKVKDAGENGSIGIGFVGSHHFRSDKMPGWYENSVGYHGDIGRYFTGDETGKDWPSNTSSSFEFTAGDTVGAGIWYDTDEIFFRKNGVLIGTLPRSVIQGGMLYPVIGLQSWGQSVRLNFGETPFMPEALPSAFNLPRHAAEMALVAVQADHCVPVTGDFYFEMEVTAWESDTLMPMQQGLAIGFTSQEHFRQDRQPGVCPQSCGYHDDGSVYSGGKLMDEYGYDRFGPGDTVGAGVFRRRNTIFFTRNGRRIASVDYDSAFSSRVLYPTLGMESFDVQVFETFGIQFFHDLESITSRLMGE